MLNLELLYDSEILHLVICPREMKKKKKKGPHKDVYVNFHSSQKSQNKFNYLLVKEETK